jgi:hypothetical protein
MNILGIGCGLQKEDYITSHKIIRSIFPDLKTDDQKTIDLISYKLDLDGVDIVFAYGAKAKRNFETYGKLSIQCLELPDFKKLEPLPENELIRKETWRKLKEFRERVESGIVLAPAQKINLETRELPDFNGAQLKALAESLRLKGISFWKGKTKSGKSIIIADNAMPSTSADIVLTFAEFYTLKSMTELLGLEQVEFVYSDESNRN